MTVPRFWREQTQRYRLVGSECNQCGRVYFPSRAVCPTCRRESVGKMVPRQLAGRGSIVSHTLVHQPADGFELQVPYVIAIIQLEEGCRVMSQVVDVTASDVRSGLAVEATFRRIREDGRSGVIYYGYKFRPVRTPGKAAAAAEARAARVPMDQPVARTRGKSAR